MTELENFTSKQIKTLIPQYDTIELNATISSASFSVEFFATINGKRMQCFQMIDDGCFTEKDFNTFSKSVVNYIRALSDFNNSDINKYTIVLKS